jgi:hypothetical protein
MGLGPILKLDHWSFVRPQKVARVVARRRSAERVRGLRAELKPFAAHSVSWAATVFVFASGRGHRVFENAEVGDFLAATRIYPRAFPTGGRSPEYI